MPTQWNLYAVHDNGEERQLSLALGLPGKEGVDWNTEFTFNEGTNNEVWPSLGIDPLSSMLLAIGGIISKLKLYVDQGYQFHMSIPAHENNAFPFEVFKMSLDHLIDIIEPLGSDTAEDGHSDHQ